MPRWSAERRAGRRHRPVISGDPEIGPTARRATIYEGTNEIQCLVIARTLR